MSRGFLHKVDYGNPENRTIKVKIDGLIAGYTYEQISRWVDKWTDPIQSIRNSWKYQECYRENYMHMMEYIPKRCISRLRVEAIKKEDMVQTERAKYLMQGLSDCIDMFSKIQNNMSPDDEYYQTFVWETKVLFFSFYDFCEPRQAEIK